MKYIHVLTGNIGDFVKEFQNRYGTAIIIKLDNGREYFAPKNEFKIYTETIINKNPSMKNLINIEIFSIETTNEGTFAHISFQNLENKESLTEGYDTVRVPVNLRPIEVSSRGNMLVNQSVKNYATAATKK